MCRLQTSSRLASCLLAASLILSALAVMELFQWMSGGRGAHQGPNGSDYLLRLLFRFFFISSQRGLEKSQAQEFLHRKSRLEVFAMEGNLMADKPARQTGTPVSRGFGLSSRKMCILR